MINLLKRRREENGRWFAKNEMPKDDNQVSVAEEQLIHNASPIKFSIHFITQDGVEHIHSEENYLNAALVKDDPILYYLVGSTYGFIRDDEGVYYPISTLRSLYGEIVDMPGELTTDKEAVWLSAAEVEEMKARRNEEAEKTPDIEEEVVDNQ